MDARILFRRAIFWEESFLYDVKRIDRWFSYLDFDECVTRTHNCSTYAVCNNTKGSHNCKCKPGYSGNGQICKGDFSCVLVVLVHVFLIKPARSLLINLSNASIILFSSSLQQICLQDKQKVLKWTVVLLALLKSPW